MRVIEHSGEVCRVVNETVGSMFRQLSKDEVGDFRAWADGQPDGTKIKSIWHPVAQDQLFIRGGHDE